MSLDCALLVITTYYVIEIPARLTFFDDPLLPSIGLEILDLILSCVCVADTIIRIKVLENTFGFWVALDAVATLPIGSLYRLANYGTDLQNGLVRRIEQRRLHSARILPVKLESP